MLWVAKAARCGKDVAMDGTVDGKSGKVRRTRGGVHGTTRAAAGGCGQRVWPALRLFKVLAARGGAVEIELKYHK